MGGVSAAEAASAAVSGTAATVAEEVPFLPNIAALGDSDTDAARYDDVLQGKIESTDYAAGGILSTTHPQRNKGNVTDVTYGMRRLSLPRFVCRPIPSKQKLQRGQGSTLPSP